MGGDNFTRDKITGEIGRGQIKVMHDIVIGAGTGKDGGHSWFTWNEINAMMVTKIG